MYRDDGQCNRATALLLDTLPGLKSMWTKDGPTEEAVRLLEEDGGLLSSGERALLLAAWELSRGRGGRVTFRDVLQINGEPFEALATLMLAVEFGAGAVEQWIGTRTAIVANADLIAAELEKSGCIALYVQIGGVVMSAYARKNKRKVCAYCGEDLEAHTPYEGRSCALIYVRSLCFGERSN